MILCVFRGVQLCKLLCLFLLTFYPFLRTPIDDVMTHFTTFALNARTGDVRWHHLPGDFEAKQDANIFNHPVHWKLALRRSGLHRKEVRMLPRCIGMDVSPDAKKFTLHWTAPYRFLGSSCAACSFAIYRIRGVRVKTRWRGWRTPRSGRKQTKGDQRKRTLPVSSVATFNRICRNFWSMVSFFFLYS